jgi:hypothetical protein
VDKFLARSGLVEDLQIVDEEFMNHVLDRFKWQQIALRDIEPVRNSVEEILALLRKELNN